MNRINTNDCVDYDSFLGWHCHNSEEMQDVYRELSEFAKRFNIKIIVNQKELKMERV